MGTTWYLPEATSTFGWTVVGFSGSLWPLLWQWLAVVNLVTFCIFGLDKWKAKRKAKNAAVRRVPEKTLFALSILGGSVGALLGMRVFHHKTLHKSFRYGIPAICIVQVLILLGIRLWPVLG